MAPFESAGVDFIARPHVPEDLLQRIRAAINVSAAGRG
jgi:DNA-binding response OmpR family regulator